MKKQLTYFALLFLLNLCFNFEINAMDNTSKILAQDGNYVYTKADKKLIKTLSKDELNKRLAAHLLNWKSYCEIEIRDLVEIEAIDCINAGADINLELDKISLMEFCLRKGLGRLAILLASKGAYFNIDNTKIYSDPKSKSQF